MPPLELPRHHVRVLQELGARLLESRKRGTESETFARELLVGFFDTSMLSGLDGVLEGLVELDPSLDLSDRTTLADSDALRTALAKQLDAIALDGGSPRNARPKQLADCLIAALGLTVVDEPDRTITLDHSVRTEVAAALATVVDAALAPPTLREAILRKARTLCEPQYIGTMQKVVEHLDEYGLRMIKQPKVPLDASQAVQRVLTEARHAVFETMGRTAIERAKAAIARVDAEAAERIDRPVTLRLTPRDVAILRVRDASVPKVPALVVESLIGSIGELARITWRAAERIARPYAASQTFAVGELISHPKFGLGTVISLEARRMDVEFPDGMHTLVHVPPAK